jgi:DNA repair exonuclease SbcCD nuclease subunit
MPSPLSFVGIGDLHLDGKLSKFIPSLNTVILSEVRKAARYARRSGIPLLVFYGDICDIPTMSAEACMLLIEFFEEYNDLNHILITGNHDVEHEGTHSLLLIKKLCSLGKLPNVKVIDQPTVLFRKRGTPLNLLPWPYFQVQAECLNVLHIETHGSRWEIGKAIESERKTSAYCVSGHLHTHQVVGPRQNIYYSGTLYQTNFGEKAEKFFHHVEWDGKVATVESVPTTPQYELINKIVATPQDLSTILPDSKKLYKVFVKHGVELDAETFSTMPNVVRINTFQTRDELNNLIAEELLLSDASAHVSHLSVMEALETYLLRATVEKSVSDRAREIAHSLFAPA